MAIKKTIDIDGKKVALKCSADTPRAYRIRFRSDMLKDMERLFSTGKQEEQQIEDLSTIENVIYIMAKQADPDSVPDDIETWLDEFNIFSIYQAMPDIMEMWGANMETQVTSKKK